MNFTPDNVRCATEKRSENKFSVSVTVVRVAGVRTMYPQHHQWNEHTEETARENERKRGMGHGQGTLATIHVI